MLFAVPDPTRKLVAGQVFVKIEGVAIRGPVVATRFPCMKLSDVRVLNAVAELPELEHLNNLCVFSVHGAQSEIAEMSGGDFDGTRALV